MVVVKRKKFSELEFVSDLTAIEHFEAGGTGGRRL